MSAVCVRMRPSGCHTATTRRWLCCFASLGRNRSYLAASVLLWTLVASLSLVCRQPPHTHALPRTSANPSLTVLRLVLLLVVLQPG